MTTATTLPPQASLPAPAAAAEETPAMQTSCPNCGAALQETQAALAAAQARIADLEAQVRLLNQKAAAAIDRWADYEDELSRLRASAPSPTTTTTTTTTVPPSPWSSVTSPSRPSFLPAAAASRITSLLSPRKSTPNLRTGPASSSSSSSPPAPPPPHPHWQPNHQQHSSTSAIPATPMSPATATAQQGTEDLLSALTREQSLRRAAESRLSTTSREVEELSVALFEQANEMVATERRARARLAERVEVLEKRDADKRRRLERLEQAVGRIDRARSLLGATATASATGIPADAPRPPSGPLPARALPEKLMLA